MNTNDYSFIYCGWGRVWSQQHTGPLLVNALLSPTEVELRRKKTVEHKNFSARSFLAVSGNVGTPSHRLGLKRCQF